MSPSVTVVVGLPCSLGAGFFAKRFAAATRA
jgi:hypothetical protein